MSLHRCTALLFLALLIAPLHFFAQTLNPVKWQFSYQETDEKNGKLVLKAKMDPDWHIYSQTQTGEGPLPTVFKFVRTPDFDLDGTTIEPDPDRLHDVTFDVDVAQFIMEATFTQKIKRNNRKDFVIMGEVEFMACNNSMCLPPRTIKFSIKVPQNVLK